MRLSNGGISNSVFVPHCVQYIYELVSICMRYLIALPNKHRPLFITNKASVPNQKKGSLLYFNIMASPNRERPKPNSISPLIEKPSHLNFNLPTPLLTLFQVDYCSFQVHSRYTPNPPPSTCYLIVLM